ncbi:ATP-binding cassette domain-containing protein [Anaerocolumna sedimenticola]|uniref:ATP-binding cassette domain-containing protein n=2 Tax=Anaerocolumna sedimenticola TaxID=2696063 RepID=A0A6P1TW68_9FIRM|nr:ATP-binding cassette domain-containing protein [Anaerocolumna sedimenticola]
MDMDFPYTEDPNTLNDIKTAIKTIQSPVNGIGLIILKLFSIPGNLIGFFVFSVILFHLNPIILIILMATVVLSYFILLRANHYERSRKDELAEEERKAYYASATLSDFLYGKDIRVYGLKGILLQKKKESCEHLIHIISEIQGKILKATVMEAFLIFIREGVIYCYLIYQVIENGLSIGNFVMYSLVMNRFADWMDTTMKDIATIGIQSMYVSDFRDFLKKEEPIQVKNPKKIPESDQFEIELKNISFQYPGSDKYILKDFSLKIKAGQRIALVGINGAGKTTLVKLLTRLYRPTEGQILLNGIDINELDREEYTTLFSVIFQDIKLFAFNLAENITFTDKEEEENIIYQVLNQAGLSEKVNSLEHGIYTNMLKVLDENGIELSGGENQKLAMARALYKGGKIIIMDEPTAALDALAESQLYKNFDELIQKRTAIYISHRLSSTRFCDVIAFIEDGEIKEYGTHEELMKLNKSYANMFQIQAVYYREEERHVS